MCTITIDCSQINSEAAFWEHYLVTTNAEGSQYFGRNLDAFWDAVNGGPGWPGEIQLRLINAQHLKQLREGFFFQGLKAIAKESKHVVLLLE